MKTSESAQQSPEPCRVSIVTPCLNMAPYLTATVDSVLNNLSPEDEYFVVDGGSSDESIDLIKGYASQLAGWISEPDKGYADALGKGFASASGDVLCWVNAGDVLLPGALEAVRYLMRDARVALIYGDVLNIDEAGAVLWKSSGSFPNLRDYMLYGGGTPWQVGCFWRRELYADVGGIDRNLRLAADYDLFLRMSLTGATRYAKRTFGAHRFHRGQLSVRFSAEYARERAVSRRRAIVSTEETLAKQAALTIIYWPYARLRARFASLMSGLDPLRGVNVSTLRCA